jgi:hypothetical protein
MLRALLCESHTLEDSPAAGWGVPNAVCVTFSLGTVGTNPIALAGSGNRGRRGPAFGAAAQLAAENRIPSFKIGGSVRFDRNARQVVEEIGGS